jgi:cytochrome P450
VSSAEIPVEVASALVDPKAYAEEERIHEAFAWLRANNPVGLIEVEGFDPFWAITKLADVQEVGRQPDLFHNADRQATLIDAAGDAQIRQMTGGSPHLIRSLVQMDPPEHPKYRNLAVEWFMPKNVNRLEERIRQIARAAIERMRERDGQCDFVKDIALGYPLHVIMEILGIPQEDESRMLQLTQELFGVQDTELMTREGESGDPLKHAEGLASVVADFNTYFRGITEDRRKNPRDDLATVIANGKIDGEPMGEFETLCYYMLVATAGHDTTSSSISGGLWALCESPGEFHKVKSDPTIISKLVNESIRWVTPVKHFMRTATADAEIRGQQIAAGDWMMLCYLSANRDEEAFEDPFTFKADRNPNKQVAFGYGAHLCLGQHLARLEMRIFFEEFFSEIAGVELAGEPKRSAATFANGPKSLPIRYRFN